MNRYIGCPLAAGMFAMTPIVGAGAQEGELFPRPSVIPEFDLRYDVFPDLVSNHMRGCVAWGGSSWGEMRGTHVDGKREGFWVESWHGRGYAAGYYGDDKREGRWLEFWPPETLPKWVEREFDRRGQFDADDFRAWIEKSGGIVVEGRYEDGERVGSWVLYAQRHEYGQRCATIVYERGGHEVTWRDGC